MFMRIIVHLDMDAFFAAVEERDRPRLKGKPIVVGADPRDGKGRGVVSTANYKAREYDIRSAMSISEAWRRSEAARREGKTPAVFVSGSYQKYSEISTRIEAIIRKRVSRVEAASVDEFYCDMSDQQTLEKAIRIAKQIKNEIKRSERLSVSVGIGPNKLVAKIASDFKKPNGFTVVKKEEVEKFLEQFPVRAIPGIGPKTEHVFGTHNIRTVHDLKKLTRETLHELFGKWGTSMYEWARGRSDSEVVESREVKSIGEQETFESDTKDMNRVVEKIHELAREVFRRFEKSKWKYFKTVVLTIRFADFTTASRSHTLPTRECSEEVVLFEALKLLAPFFDKRENPSKKLFRLVGVRIEKLS